MDKNNMKFSTDDSFKDMSYTAELPGLLWSYAEKFHLAETLLLKLESEVVLSPDKEHVDPINVSDDYLNIIISYKASLYYRKKNKLTNLPKPEELFSSLHRLLKRAVKEDNSRNI